MHKVGVMYVYTVCMRVHPFFVFMKCIRFQPPLYDPPPHHPPPPVTIFHWRPITIDEEDTTVGYNLPQPAPSYYHTLPPSTMPSYFHTLQLSLNPIHIILFPPYTSLLAIPHSPTQPLTYFLLSLHQHP